MLNFMAAFKNERLMKALTGMKINEFKQIAKEFSKILYEQSALKKRQINSIKEFFEYFPKTQDLFVDATERRIQRPKDSKNQKRRYSGKKKFHSRKNTIIADKDKRILFLSKSKNGREHDLTQLRKSGILQHIPPGANIWGDKAYQGVKKDVDKDVNVFIPHKKSKKKKLTNSQKQENKIISGIRICVEHAICGIKKFRALSDIFRNKKGQDNTIMAVCSGLWNYHLQNI